MLQRFGLALILLLFVTGCATFRIPSNLSAEILSSDDLELVEDGLPTYLLTMDGLVRTYPRNARVLSTAAELNSAYAGVFVESEERQKRYSAKALDLATRAACREISSLCDIREQRVSVAEQTIDGVDRTRDAPMLYLLGSIWAGYIQAHSDDWNAVAQLPKAQRLLEQQVKLDPGYNHAMGELYLGVIASILPPALGGQPEVAREYFERAIELSRGRNLIVKVFYAQDYARLMFDQELHDDLLEQVLAADPNQGQLTLQNAYAQSLARELLATSNDYFF